MNSATMSLDIAKDVFQAHGVGAHGKVVLHKQLKRNQVPAFFANLPPCLLALEACADAHHWARELVKLGHDARLIGPSSSSPTSKAARTTPTTTRPGTYILCANMGKRLNKQVRQPIL